MKTLVPILNLELWHAYYQHGRSGDVSFEPSKRTKEFIKGHRLRIREFSTGFQVFAPAEDGTFFIPMPTEVELSWYVIVKNPLFWQITALPKKDPTGSFVISDQDSSWTRSDFQHFGGLYDGHAEASPDQASIIGGIRKAVSMFTAKVVVPRHSQEQIDNDRLNQTIQLEVKASVDSTINEDFQFSGDGDQVLWHLHPNRDRLEARPSLAMTQDLPVTVKYPIAKRPRSGVLATLTIRLQPAIVQPRTMSLQFMPRKEVWRYFIVTHSDIDFGDAIKLITGQEEFAMNQEANMTMASLTNDLEKQTLGKLQSQINGAKVALLRSAVPIPFQERAVYSLMFKDKTIEKLPPPALTSHGIHILFHPTISTNS